MSLVPLGSVSIQNYRKNQKSTLRGGRARSQSSQVSHAASASVEGVILEANDPDYEGNFEGYDPSVQERFWTKNPLTLYKKILNLKNLKTFMVYGHV